MNCPRCHAAIRDEAQFCSACGEHFPADSAPPVLCRRCGVANREVARFCRSCGSPLPRTHTPPHAYGGRSPRPAPAASGEHRSAAQHAPGSTVTQALRIVPPPPPRLRAAVGAETLAPGEHPVVVPVRAPQPDAWTPAPPLPESASAPATQALTATAPVRASSRSGASVAPRGRSVRGPRPALVRGVIAGSGAAIVVLGGALLWMRHQPSSSATPARPGGAVPSPSVVPVPSPDMPRVSDGGARPELPFVLSDICPGSGCRYGQWWAPASMSVYAAPDSSLVAVSTLEAGEPFMALEGRMSVADPGTVTLGQTCALTDTAAAEATSVTLAQGDTVFVLQSDGEGRYVVWHRGQVLRVPDFWSREVAGCRGQMTHPGTAATWWIHARDKRGRSGWVVNPANHALLAPPDEPGLTAVAARRSEPTPAPVTDALRIALARARRAQQEGRIFAPAGNCALTSIADALAVAPQSPEAKRWLDDLAAGTLAEATRSASENRTDAALARLDEAIAAARARPELGAFEARLSQKREWLYRATRTFEVGHDHGSKRVAWESVQGDLTQAGCSGSLELTERGFAFKTRESLDGRRDSVSIVAARDIKELELKDEDTRLRVKTAGQGTWSFVGSPDAMRRIYDHLRARFGPEER